MTFMVPTTSLEPGNTNDMTPKNGSGSPSLLQNGGGRLEENILLDRVCLTVGRRYCKFGQYIEVIRELELLGRLQYGKSACLA
jgi:hypothetical protein